MCRLEAALRSKERAPLSQMAEGRAHGRRRKKHRDEPNEDRCYDDSADDESMAIPVSGLDGRPGCAARE